MMVTIVAMTNVINDYSNNNMTLKTKTTITTRIIATTKTISIQAIITT